MQIILITKNEKFRWTNNEKEKKKINAPNQKR